MSHTAEIHMGTFISHFMPLLISWARWVVNYSLQKSMIMHVHPFMLYSLHISPKCFVPCIVMLLQPILPTGRHKSCP